MKGVVLAGGTGSRLWPLTRATNKSLLPVGEEPIVVRVLNVLLRADVKDILVVTGSDHIGQLVSLLGSGAWMGCDLTYKVQDKADGIAAALKLAEPFVGDSRFAVILGDNIFEDVHEAARVVSTFDRSTDEYGLVVKEVPDPGRFGVVEYRDGKAVDVLEKPSEPPSYDAVLGLYLYTPTVFDIVRALNPSKRGEYEISDVNAQLVKTRRGTISRIERGWVDAGTHDSLWRANLMVRGIK